MNESQVFAMGEWASIDSLKSWLKKFGEDFGSEFQSFVTGQKLFTLTKKATAELDELMGDWNAPIYENVAGFVRFS